ncbi:MAG: UDP-glucose/GDP-mannose dehydrogenase family protein [Alphaproteobacteria bacterium]|nr:UDP-glucose/GDP-mannose dehydrogenase family protein [Alphaproteobacteria bacterium]
MKITVIGTGYVGLPTGVGLAELGNDVVCLDIDENKINTLKSGKVTIFEEGLEELFKKNTENGKVRFSTSFAESIPQADLVILAVGTPPNPITKEADMKYIKAAAESLAHHLQGYTVIAVKSTVPVNTGTAVENIVRQVNPTAEFDVISLPEFLREGFAVQDFFNPDRIIVGANTQRARDLIAELYAPFKDKSTILYVSRQSSETIKYASNAFLAMKIQYINEMADFCETSGADIYEVAKGMGLDSRIGAKFLVPGPGYGGFCFPKDTNAMAYMGKFNGVDLSLIETTIKSNERRKINMAKRILDMVDDVKNPTIAVLGSAFKGGTDDCRESPALQIIEIMLAHDVQIRLYDPQAMDNTKAILKDMITYCNSAYEAIGGADVLAVLTDWPEFKELDLSRIKQLMKRPQIADYRNTFDCTEAKNLGFEIKSLGRKL